MTTPQAMLTEAELAAIASRIQWAGTHARLSKREASGLVAMARAHLSAGGWREISSAPKDQRSILAVHINSGIQKVSWRSGINSDYYQWGCDDETWKPTHWQPLPLPPTPSGEEQKEGGFPNLPPGYSGPRGLDELCNDLNEDIRRELEGK